MHLKKTVMRSYKFLCNSPWEYAIMPWEIILMVLDFVGISISIRNSVHTVAKVFGGVKDRLYAFSLLRPVQGTCEFLRVPIHPCS